MLSLVPKTWLAVAAIVLAIAGLADSVYLTVHHYTAEPVPCSLIEGCEMVLTSQYAEVQGIPLALIGAVGYFIAFSLALLTLYGYRLWPLFGIQAAVMAIVSGILIYIQASLIGAFCQFCLISAATSVLLFLVFVLSILLRKNSPSLETEV
ncbi:MAG TPA: vitamin K epoxide reductase family protein [Pyrinomonadaceae bacterium]|nr:vitamin K epoxide reductase family protein [Pyrinomonadaceae bacterium]